MPTAAELAGLYSTMEDEELLRIAADFEGLTHDAAVVFKAEIERRAAMQLGNQPAQAAERGAYWEVVAMRRPAIVFPSRCVGCGFNGEGVYTLRSAERSVYVGIAVRREWITYDIPCCDSCRKIFHRGRGRQIALVIAAVILGSLVASASNIPFLLLVFLFSIPAWFVKVGKPPVAIPEWDDNWATFHFRDPHFAADFLKLNLTQPTTADALVDWKTIAQRLTLQKAGSNAL